ncbi:MAG: TetR/AcrR family transcriptional regulator [Rhodobacterales bacterium]|nr:TetR/AcrR family transcriptional regulator [Rhodobacterales bacterium]
MAQPAIHPGNEERSLEILFSIRKAFADKGFDGASMQDLARAAGMSVGNFYRYFPSKGAIVEAMVGYDLTEIERDFGEIQSSADPMAGLRAKIIQRMTEDCGGDSRLWAEITAVSMRKPEVLAVSQQMESTVVAHLSAIFARVTGRNHADAIRRYAGQCRLLVMLVKAMAMETGKTGTPNPELTEQVIPIIDRVFAEISNDIARG